MDDRRIDIEAIEARIARLRYRLFELRHEDPIDVPMGMHTREYRTVAEFGWQHEGRGDVAIVGRCLTSDGKTGSYRFMLDRRLLDRLHDRDVFSYWEHVLTRTIKHLAMQMFDPEKERQGHTAGHSSAGSESTQKDTATPAPAAVAKRETPTDGPPGLHRRE